MNIKKNDKIFLSARKVKLIAKKQGITCLDNYDFPNVLAELVVDNIEPNKKDGGGHTYITARLPNSNSSVPETITFRQHICTKDVGVLIIKIGDLQSEEATLNPLSDSINLFFKLFFPNSSLFTYSQIRTYKEFETIMGVYTFPYIILIGHSSSAPNSNNSTVLKFIDKEISAKELSTTIFDKNGVYQNNNVTIISLVCQTGKSDFAKILSASYKVKSVIAPYQNLHIAIASQFCQTFFLYHFLEGSQLKTAYKKAYNAVPDATSFKLWIKGKSEVPKKNN